MNDSLLESFLVPCDELKAEEFITSSVIIFQGDRLPKTFTIDCIITALVNMESPWMFIAKEKLKNRFYIAIGFEENSNTPFYATNLLCTFIKNKVFISNVYKCSKDSTKFRKICIKHKKKIQLDLETQKQNKSNEFFFQNQEKKDVTNENSINLIQSTNEPNVQNIIQNEVPATPETDVISSLFIPDSPPPSPQPSQINPPPVRWTENLPIFTWDKPINEFSVAQSEIEANLGLFNEAVLIDNETPLKLFQNIAQEQLMFAPHSNQKFLERIVKHESIFEINEDSKY